MESEKTRAANTYTLTVKADRASLERGGAQESGEMTLVLTEEQCQILHQLFDVRQETRASEVETISTADGIGSIFR